MAEYRDTTVTFLEMSAPPAPGVARSPSLPVAMLRAQPMPVHYYRYLYDVIGRPWCWVARKRVSDRELSAILEKETTEVYILYASGVPAGFAELDFSDPRFAELAYFGLVPDFIGHGLGPYFLHQILDTLWHRNPEKVLLNTCTLDHPKALALYQRIGFRPYAQEKHRIELLDEDL